MATEPDIAVVNRHWHKPQPGDVDIYVGRGSPLGNPFTHMAEKATRATYVVGSRTEAIAKFREHLNDAIERRDPAVRDALNGIWRASKQRKVNLVCYCAPHACHAEVIREIVIEKARHVRNRPTG